MSSFPESRSTRTSASESRAFGDIESGYRWCLTFWPAGGRSRDLLEQYPGIEEADVLACIAYGAEMSRERYVDVPLEASA